MSKFTLWFWEKFDLYSTLVTALYYSLSGFVGPRYNSTRRYRVGTRPCYNANILHICMQCFRYIPLAALHNKAWIKSLTFHRQYFKCISSFSLKCVPQGYLYTYNVVPYIHIHKDKKIRMSWWRHQMAPFSALLAICAGNSRVTGDFPTQRPVTRSFDAFFDLGLNKRFSKQSQGWWFDTPLRLLWRHCNVPLHTSMMICLHCLG